MFLILGQMNLLVCHVPVLRSYESTLILGHMNLLGCHVSVLKSYESSDMSCFCPLVKWNGSTGMSNFCPKSNAMSGFCPLVKLICCHFTFLPSGHINPLLCHVSVHRLYESPGVSCSCP